MSQLEQEIKQLGLNSDHERALLTLPLVVPFCHGGPCSQAERDAVVEAATRSAELELREAGAVRRLCHEEFEGRRLELALDLLARVVDEGDPRDRAAATRCALRCHELIGSFARKERATQKGAAKPEDSAAEPGAVKGEEWFEFSEDLVSQARRKSLGRIATRIGVELPSLQAGADSKPRSESSEGTAEKDRSDQEPVRRYRAAMRTDHQESKEGGLI